MFIVDRVEDGFVVLENYGTKEYFPVEKEVIGFDVVDGDTLKLVDGKYYKDEEFKKDREETIREKLERLKNI